jgi:glycosyltransferase involved in cell wall biosynthesis
MNSGLEESGATLTVVVVARDEESRIGACLDSVAFADERLVVDTGSTDRTRDVASAYGARVVDLKWRGFGPTKAEALDLAGGDWLLLLDADERVDPTLASAIGAAIGQTRSDSPEGYELCRRSLFLGRWLSHGGWYPDWVLRLVRRGKFRMVEAPVHESLEVSGRRGRLPGELLHETDPDLGRYLRKLDLYTDLAARDLAARGARFRLRDLVLRPPATFVKRYLLKAGFRDGVPGFLLAALSATHVLVKYARLWELAAARRGAAAERAESERAAAERAESERR